MARQLVPIGCRADQEIRLARAKSRNVPTSVILTETQRDFLKRAAAAQGRTYSGLLRWIVLSWIDFQTRKENGNGEKGKEARQKGGKEGEKSS